MSELEMVGFEVDIMAQRLSVSTHQVQVTIQDEVVRCYLRAHTHTSVLKFTRPISDGYPFTSAKLHIIPFVLTTPSSSSPSHCGPFSLPLPTQDPHLWNTSTSFKSSHNRRDIILIMPIPPHTSPRSMSIVPWSYLSSPDFSSPCIGMGRRGGCRLSHQNLANAAHAMAGLQY